MTVACERGLVVRVITVLMVVSLPSRLNSRSRNPCTTLGATADEARANRNGLESR